MELPVVPESVDKLKQMFDALYEYCLTEQLPSSEAWNVFSILKGNCLNAELPITVEELDALLAEYEQKFPRI